MRTLRKKKRKHSLRSNSYGGKVIRKATHRYEDSMAPHTPRDRASDLPTMRTAFLPYVKGTTDRIKRVLMKHNIKTTFNTATTTRSLLGSVKDPLPMKTSGVYEIPRCCGETYIGQTGRLISTRIQEHIRATKNNDMKSAVAEHSMETGHLIDWNQSIHFNSGKCEDTGFCPALQK
ncbi:hypothetical protein AAG570_013269 [Ranatra chinensis]|uniref:GIY-YIG domain-containing protein n=1 Tax=Ranatra chinensis TaxID=642074 RepID=A0ABD0YG89_9HEMI